jgi:hypothetical protein
VVTFKGGRAQAYHPWQKCLVETQVRRKDAPLHLTCTYVVGLPGFEPGTS